MGRLDDRHRRAVLQDPLAVRGRAGADQDANLELGNLAFRFAHYARDKGIILLHLRNVLRIRYRTSIRTLLHPTGISLLQVQCTSFIL